jgi:hypothetical protein
MAASFLTASAEKRENRLLAPGGEKITARKLPDAEFAQPAIEKDVV